MFSDPHLAPHFDASALITVDVQRDFLSEAEYGTPGTTETLPSITRLTEAFRAAARPIVHVVRLYLPDGSNAELVRRTWIRSGAHLVAPGTPGSELAPGVAPPQAPELDPEVLLAGGVQRLGPREYAMFKPRWGAFHRTPLQGLLDQHGVDTVVVVGCNLPNCPRATMIEASERDYRVVAVPEGLSRRTPEALRDLGIMGVNVAGTAEVVGALAG
ncbi:MAG: isochorismatase family cysteine hydrolase [Kineosporiaceae bacterium]